MFQELNYQMEFVSAFGAEPLFASVLLIFVIVYLWKKSHTNSATVMALSAVSIIYSTALKEVFKWQRPEAALAKYYLPFDVYSFPSTHVVFYTAFWGFLFYLSFKYVKEGKLFFHILRWACVYMLITVGASRVFLGVHFVKDIIGGYFFGLMFLIPMIWLDKNLDKSGIKNKEKNKEKHQS